MAYLPKSQVTVKHTPGGLLKYKSNSKPFKGDYILTSTGNYYEGKSNVDLGLELILDDVSDVEKAEKRNGDSVDVQKHRLFKGGIDKFLSNTKTIPYEKPTPTEEDYEKGYFKRYFCTPINEEIYIEISKDTFEALIKKEPKKYDYNLYEPGSIIWHLIGNVHKLNSINIEKLQKFYKKINNLFSLLNEYQAIENIIQSNLYTNGGELFYSDKKPYVGDYHIHPENGPMEGANHTNTPHNRLYYQNDLSTEQMNLEDIQKALLEQQKGPAYKNPRKNIPKGRPKANLKPAKTQAQKYSKKSKKSTPKKYIKTNKKLKINPNLTHAPAPSSTTTTTKLNVNSSIATGKGPSAPSSGGGGGY